MYKVYTLTTGLVFFLGSRGDKPQKGLGTRTFLLIMVYTYIKVCNVKIGNIVGYEYER
jgi:hypothetical protein